MLYSAECRAARYHESEGWADSPCYFDRRTCTRTAGDIKARWRTTENNRRAKYYELTRKGRAELEDQTDTWRRLVAAIGQVLETA